MDDLKQIKRKNNILFIIIIILSISLACLIIYLLYDRIVNSNKIGDKSIITNNNEESANSKNYSSDLTKDLGDNITLPNEVEPIPDIESSLVSGSNGVSVTLGGYNWHIIGQDNNKIVLLMDSNQIPKMRHCTNDIIDATDCGTYNSYYQYSWDKSLIRKYLNTTFLDTLSDEIKNALMETQVCKNGTIYSKDVYSYGGYLKNEIDSLNETCDSGYTSDKVRLISVSELHNLSPYFTNESYPVQSIYDNGIGQIPQVDYITKISDTSWLYGSCNGGAWWTMGALSSDIGPNYTKVVYYADCSGGISYYNADVVLDIRPVIVLKK